MRPFRKRVKEYSEQNNMVDENDASKSQPEVSSSTSEDSPPAAAAPTTVAGDDSGKMDLTILASVADSMKPTVRNKVVDAEVKEDEALAAEAPAAAQKVPPSSEEDPDQKAIVEDLIKQARMFSKDPLVQNSTLRALLQQKGITPKGVTIPAPPVAVPAEMDLAASPAKPPASKRPKKKVQKASSKRESGDSKKPKPAPRVAAAPSPSFVQPQQAPANSTPMVPSQPGVPANILQQLSQMLNPQVQQPQMSGLQLGQLLQLAQQPQQQSNNLQLTLLLQLLAPQLSSQTSISPQVLTLLQNSGLLGASTMTPASMALPAVAPPAAAPKPPPPPPPAATAPRPTETAPKMPQWRTTHRMKVTVPCRARGLPSDHNSRTAYFEIPEDASHGRELTCSYPECAKSGVKFLYCLYCQIPVAKRNFRLRHSHQNEPFPSENPISAAQCYPIVQPSIAQASSVKAQNEISKQGNEKKKSKSKKSEEKRKRKSSKVDRDRKKKRKSHKKRKVEESETAIPSTIQIDSERGGGVAFAVESTKPESKSHPERQPNPGKQKTAPENVNPDGKQKQGVVRKDDGRVSDGSSLTCSDEHPRESAGGGEGHKRTADEGKKHPGQSAAMRAVKRRENRVRIWSRLLKKRPTNKDGEAMSRWLAEVVAVSDLVSPLPKSLRDKLVREKMKAKKAKKKKNAEKKEQEKKIAKEPKQTEKDAAVELSTIKNESDGNKAITTDVVAL